MRPENNSFPDYYGLYIPLIKENDVCEALEANAAMIKAFMPTISSAYAEYSYAPGKWTIKQVISHIIDTERILAYRALRFARKDPQKPLAFEENDYAANAELSNRTLNDLLEEFEAVRRSSVLLFRSFSADTLLQKGNTHIGTTTVLALGYFICGHAKHHINVIQQRYLKTEEKIASN